MAPDTTRRGSSARSADAGPGGGATVYRVSELTRVVAARLEELGRLRVEGEVSGLRSAASGHLYFDLKEGGAVLPCAVWRSQRARAVRFELEEGARVVAHGRLDVYAPRGRYTFLVDRLEQLGLGALLAQLEALKAELRERGWFERRRALPALPRVIGLVTSRDGAALRDFLRTRSLRWPGYPVRLCHTAVQGPGAAEEIAAAIERLDASGVDLIVVTRGGGSLEDLWSFNERAVAEAVWRASVPVVSAVGHESDTCLSDLVADHRAHTPTDAAQTVIPERAELERRLVRASSYLADAVGRALERREERLARLGRSRALRDPGRLLAQRAGLLREVRARLELSVRRHLDRPRERLGALRPRLDRFDPRAALARWSRRLATSAERLFAAGRRCVDGASVRVRSGAERLEALSPLRVLARGYSITRRAGGGAVVTDAAALAPGDELETRLAAGRVASRVVGVEPAPPAEPGARPAGGGTAP